MSHLLHMAGALITVNDTAFTCPCCGRPDDGKIFSQGLEMDFTLLEDSTMDLYFLRLNV